MKKSLLLAAAFVLSLCTASAQLALRPKLDGSFKKAQFAGKAPKGLSEFHPQRTANAIKKAPGGAVGYDVPASMPCLGHTDEFEFLSGSVILVPTAYKDFSFKNTSKSPKSTKWLVNGSVDLSQYGYVDENYDFINAVEAGFYFPMPTLSAGAFGGSYTYGDGNVFGASDYPSKLMTLDDIYPLTWSDPHLGQDVMYGGYLDSHYVYGTGSVASDGATYVSIGCMQNFPEPQSPMYVEDIFVIGATLNYDGDPIPAGEAMKLHIINDEDEELMTLVAAKEDATLIGEDEEDGNVLRYYSISFKLKEDGEQVPFVLEEAFTTLIEFSPNTNIGFTSHISDACETMGAAANVLVNTANPSDVLYSTVGGNDMVVNIALHFNALYDMVSTWADAVARDENGNQVQLTDFNVLQVSDDGQSAYNVGFSQYNFLVTYSACSFYNEDHTDQNYFLADSDFGFPSWVRYGVDNSSWETEDEDDFAGEFYTVVQCEPLPEGVKGRGCKLYYVGRGYIDPTPIYILQGNYTKEQCDRDEADGITTPTASKPSHAARGIYNLNGQRVSPDTKGIVIKNGKKLFNR